jgi:hypothetical protein
LAGLTNAIDYLLAAKWFCDSRALDDVKDRGLLGREALATLWAFAAAADLEAIFNYARVDYAGIIMSAEWAVHVLGLLSNSIGRSGNLA